MAGLTSLFTGAFTGRLAAAVGCPALSRRCLCLTGPVAAKPVAARRCRDRVKARTLGAVAKNDLLIIWLPITLSVKSARICWPEQVLPYSTGAAEYSILYTGTWVRQANSSLLYHLGHSLREILTLEIVNKQIISCVRCPRLRQHRSEERRVGK